MSCRKILMSSHNILVRNATPFKKNSGEMVTRGTAFSTPPRVRISFVEKMILCSIISVSVLATPAWILYHLPEYKGETRE